MAYTQLLYHIVFRTKSSRPTILLKNERLMYHYIFKTCESLGCVTLRIGGMPDHIHILVSIPATVTIAQFVEKIKVSSSKRFKLSEEFPDFEGWASGYAALTYAFGDKETVINYIKNQKEHHRSVTFSDEYRKLISDAGIPINNDYFLKD